MSPLFSIIIPAYNVAPYLANGLNSVLNQNFDNFEIILIDDGSHDETLNIAKQYRQKYQNITLLSQPNQGVSVARNHGIQLARGEYVLFLDGDDCWRGQNALTDLANLIDKNQGVDLILYTYCGENLLTGKNARPRFPIHQPVSEIQSFPHHFKDLVDSGAWVSNVWTKVIRREILLRHQIICPENKHYEDFAFCFDLAKHLKTYLIYNQIFYQYLTLRPHSATSQNKQKLQDFLTLLTMKLADIQQFYADKNPLFEGALAYWAQNFTFAVQFFNESPPEMKAQIFDDFQFCVNIYNQLKKQSQ